MAGDPNAFDDFFGDVEDEAIVDTRAEGRLLRVPLGRIAANRVNPRTNFGTKEELEDLGRSLKRRQIQAVPVVTRSAYLKLWPEHESAIGNVDVVIVSGERRFRAASSTGLLALDCVINDDVAKDTQSFLDSVVSENIDRANFDPIEEAHAVEALVAAFGTGRAVAQHYQRADGWVTQRRILLTLAPATQDLVRTRMLPLEPARRLGKLVKDHGWDEAQQLGWWKAEQEQRRAQSSERKAAKRAAAAERPALRVDANPTDPSRPAAGAPDTGIAEDGPVDSRAEHLPSPRSYAEMPEPEQRKPSLDDATSVDRTMAPESAAAIGPAVELAPGESGWIDARKQVTRMPWHDGRQVADLILEKMDGTQRTVLLEYLLAAHTA
ncbi:ParB N-terminal domain-containing protein (plasmid) [Streptomyces virginiae]|uniref:ParB/RepB/Spo0J family partition protein n=1 Tax=Streptomyces virginiae TaxID=1961 RepID=UPI002DDA82E7|nr:ParB N-terminal domain-containing protein [Streptomyces virginiae]WSC82765.1 ParB N-terminal domain-containing protein [Streptomyces virginiae]